MMYQDSLVGLRSELQRLRGKNARLEEQLDGRAQRCSLLLQVGRDDIT